MNVPWLFLAQLAVPAADSNYGWVAPTSALGFAITIIYLFLTRRIRTGGEVEDERSEKNAWKQIAQDSTDAARTAQELLKKSTEQGEIMIHMLDELKRAANKQVKRTK